MTKDQQETLKHFAEEMVSANRKMWEAQEIAAAAKRDFEGFIQKCLNGSEPPKKSGRPRGSKNKLPNGDAKPALPLQS